MRIFISLFLFMSFSLFHNLSAQRLLIGTYAGKNDSKGIYVYDFDASTGKAQLVSTTSASNPSYLAVATNNQFVYSVNENNQGMVSAFAYDQQTGKLTFINQQPSLGSAPCYISIDRSGKWLFTGNYSSGNLTVHPIGTNGAVGPVQDSIQHSGSSINKERQLSPHVHCTYISGDNQFLYVSDLGLDQLMVYNFDAHQGRLELNPQASVSLSPGGGPRHIVFTRNGRFGYLVEEMSGAVNLIERKENKHIVMQTLNLLKGNNDKAGGDIHLSPDEKFLYVSQRSNSTVQIFKVSPKTGRLRFVAEQSTKGNFPRNIVIHPSGDFLLAANQKSGDIVIFRRNAKTGLLKDTGERIVLPSPVCLKWIAEPQ